MSGPRPLVLREGEGATTADPLGRPIVVKIGPGDSSGAYTLTESLRQPGLGAPTHVHAEHEEAFYVLAGRVRFRIGEEEVDATAGTCALVPRGVEHSFEVVEEARYLCIFSPPATPQERERLQRNANAARERGLTS